MQKSPRSAKGRSGKGRHSHSYMNGILYTAKRQSTTYNDIIPANEQKKKSFFANKFEGFLSKLSDKHAEKHKAQPEKLHYGRHGRAAKPPKEEAVKAPRASIFQDRSVVLVSLVCLAVAVTSVIAVPIAFCKR